MGMFAGVRYVDTAHHMQITYPDMSGLERDVASGRVHVSDQVP